MEYWRKNLYVLWSTQFLAMMGMNLVVPFLPFYLRQLGVNNDQELARWSGLVFSGPFLVSFFMAPVWGMLGDRYGQKLMVVRALFGLGISQFLIGLAASPIQVFIFRMVQGAISGFIASALTLVSITTPRHKQGYALGILQSASSAGTVMGPLFGGVMADLFGYRELFFIVTAICIIGGFIVISLVEDVRPEDRPTKNYSLIDNYKFVLKSPYLRIVGVTIFLSQMAVLLIEPIFALFIETFTRNTRYLATLAGAIFSIVGIFMVISAPWWGRLNDRKGMTKRNLLIALSTTSVMYFLHTIVTSLVGLSFLRAVLGFARGGILPALYSLTSVHTPPQRRGGIMGIATSFTVLGNMIGPLAGGYIASEIGIVSCFYFITAILILTTLFVYYMLPAIASQQDHGAE
jgi:DHA1 family multidrug resistance protein-like MFS transporter